MEASCTQTEYILAWSPLDNGDVDVRQRQLARQHQPCRTSSGDHHRMLGHRHTPISTNGTPATANRSAKAGDAKIRDSAPTAPRSIANPTIDSTFSRHPYVDNNARMECLLSP
jgi:hypothetical protein